MEKKTIQNLIKTLLILWVFIVWFFSFQNKTYAQQTTDCYFTWSVSDNWDLSIVKIGNKSLWVFYSITWATYPKTCSQNSDTLTCIDWNLLWNYQIFKYNKCKDIWWLVDWVDLALNIKIPWWDKNWWDVAQYSYPSVIASITNQGKETLTATSIPAWFISCSRESNYIMPIYSSRPVATFVSNPWTTQNITINLTWFLTQALWEKDIKCRIDDKYYTDTNPQNNIWKWKITVIKASRFDIAINRSIEPIRSNLEAPEINSPLGWAQTISNFIYSKVMEILVPLIIIVWILISILWFYKLLFSSDEKSLWEGTRYILYWLIGIIIIMSAKFIWATIINLVWAKEISWSIMAQWIYNDLVYPFLKLVIYLVLWVMFVILLSRVIWLIFGTDTETKKKAWTIIWRNAISILIIIWSKQIVETIYWARETIIQNVSNLWEIGTGILADKNIPILYQIINRVLWLASFVILVIILVQTFLLLTKPDGPNQMKKIKNSLLYIFIWIIVIWTGYLLTNFLIIN